MDDHQGSQLFCLDVFFALALLFILCFFLLLWPPGPPFFLLSVFNVLSASRSPSASVGLLRCRSKVSSSLSEPRSFSFFFPDPRLTLPPSPSFVFLSVSDGSLYSAMSSVAGHAGSIRRTFGSQKLLKTENIWLLSE